MNLIKRIALAITLLWSVTACAVNDNLKAFPAAEKGQVRYVLELPEAADESALKVEIIVGKTGLLDAANRYFYAGQIEAVNIDGWGYTRYVVKDLGPMAGTLMAVDPAAPKVERFITLGGEPYLVRYNSKLPVVVYVPAGTEVKYRVWQAGSLTDVIKR
ncbi:MAG: proteinase inhibitor I4 serpin [Gammaproteobacteria bacterium]|nr:MAG: proteinase inhibitor I4 serpin [Gammaproteobacteria bacterium]